MLRLVLKTRQLLKSLKIGGGRLLILVALKNLFLEHKVNQKVLFGSILQQKNIGGNSQILRIQTVDTLSDGITPTIRELDNADRAR